MPIVKRRLRLSGITLREAEALEQARADGKHLTSKEIELLAGIDALCAVFTDMVVEGFGGRDNLKNMDNVIAGLDSPDLIQREKFKALYAKLEDVPPRQLKEILQLIERAKRKRGRKKGSEIDDSATLDVMRPLVTNGMSIPAAARDCAKEARVFGTEKSTAKRLERKYRERCKSGEE